MPHKQILRILSITILLLSVGLGLSSPSLADPPAYQPQPPGWIIWEMTDSPQTLAVENDTLWVGSHGGGLYQWHIEQGYQHQFDTTNGLVGNDVTDVLVDNAGWVWTASLDGGVSRSTVTSANFGTPPPSNAFSDRTPTNGERAWALAEADNGDVWLATLGSGVYVTSSGSSWTNYTTANSDLPFDDVYAVDIEGSNVAWFGTIGYGLAGFDTQASSNAWEIINLTTELSHPNPDLSEPFVNNAITDIYVAPNGDKWLATDGSGVVRLNSSNSETIYNTGNTAALRDNFVHSITPDQALWFGTLGGGVTSANTSGSSWQTGYSTNNSLLPEDDVLDVAIDANGGQWFATFDEGLSYYGNLPLTPFQLTDEPIGAPDYVPGQVKSYYLWQDPETYLWHLAWSGDGQSHNFIGRIWVDGQIVSAESTDFEAGDTLSLTGASLAIEATESNGEDKITFELAHDVTQITFDLTIDGAYRPFNIQLGETGVHPPTAPFQLAPPQPVPPVLTVDIPTEIQPSVDEGTEFYLTGQIDDADSPLDHTISWDMGDGTIIEDTLFPSHSYDDNGVYDVTLTVTDIHGSQSVDTLQIIVDNVPPEVDFFYDPSRPEPGQTLTFESSIFDPGTADTHSYLWNFGDGSFSLISPIIEHTYTALGEYDVTLTVTDDDGGVTEVIYPVTINPFGADFVGYPNVELPPFEATFYDISIGDVAQRTWDFGDGSPPVTTTEVDVQHTYQNPGIYDVTLTVVGPSGTNTLVRTEYVQALTTNTDGTVILEAEDFTWQLLGTGPNWETEAGLPGYSGSGYVKAGPDMDIQFGADEFEFEAELQYAMGLTVLDTYYVWVRGQAANGAGDSIYVGFDGVPLTTDDYLSDYAPGSWGWSNTYAISGQPITIEVTEAGLHTLNIWIREDGVSLDQIIITTDPNFTP